MHLKISKQTQTLVNPIVDMRKDCDNLPAELGFVRIF